MGSISIWHWLIVGAIVCLVFGTRKLRSVGGDLGAAVRGFKDAMHTDTPDAQTTLATAPVPENPQAEAHGFAAAQAAASRDAR